MPAEIWNCKEIADSIKAKASKLRTESETPKLQVISVGEDPASKVYMKNKGKDCSEVGFGFEHTSFNENATTDEVLEAIQNSEATGIICQLPVLKHINVDAIIDTIPLEKDVDCFKPENLGNLMLGRSGFRPCTPAGVMEILSYHNIELVGKKVTILGRSNIVGKPLANMMINAGATTAICNSHSKIEEFTYDADIIVSAVGKARLITPDMIGNNPIIIDVGINRDANGKLCGDVSKDCIYNSKALTPVPGGVGLMTRAILIDNLAKTCN